MAAALLREEVSPAHTAAPHAVSHLDLLRAARELQRTALRDDTEALREQLRPFRDALVQHTREERHAFLHLPPITQLVVARGQRQLLELIDALTAAPRGDCACRARVAELSRRLTRQARLEARLLSSRPRPGVTTPAPLPD
jgi:predicted short-subunit dehydrogenase-like oxidoreductase (DUF2520 family)